MEHDNGDLGDIVEPGRSGIFGNRGRIILVAMVLLLALSYLAFTAFPGTLRYYMTVEELVDRQQEMDGKTVRVVGALLSDSFKREPGTTNASFILTDGNEILDATYTGVLPDLFFNPHSEIILEGTFGLGGLFHGDAVIVKCPSKYQALESDNL